MLFRGAHQLGFPLVRIQSAKPELLRRLLPIAERLELKLAYEIHAPLGPNAPEIMKVREVYEELDSPLLGFVADFSSTMHEMSPTLLRAVRGAGLDDDAVVAASQGSGRPTPRCANVRRSSSATSEAATSIPAGSARSPTSRSTCTAMSPRSEWADIMPQILHVHAKFYDIDEHGQEPAIDYPEHRAGVRRGRLPRLLVERVGGPRVR